jgi:hypothetical protein
MINDCDNTTLLACRDEGQIILIRAGFVNRGVGLRQSLMAFTYWSEIKNVSLSDWILELI